MATNNNIFTLKNAGVLIAILAGSGSIINSYFQIDENFNEIESIKKKVIELQNENKELVKNYYANQIQIEHRITKCETKLNSK